jgi:outer membrane cobalamin receptor
MAKAKQNPSAGVWIAAAFGVVAVGGVIYVVTRPKAAANPALSTAAGATLAPSNLSPCQKANALAALAATSANPAGELAPYNVYAAQCRAAGGTPNPFPVV